ncbi:MAG: discoidin domain-containing protein [Isosphaeraceae bacterium]
MKSETLSSALNVVAALLLGLALAAPRAASAQAVVGATNVTTNMGNFSSSTPIGNVIDQSGLSTGYTSGVTDFATYIAGNPTHFSASSGLDWISSTGVTTGNVDFDLGAAFTIDRFALWNIGDNDSRNLTGFTLLASPDNTFATTTNLGSFTASTTDPAAAAPAQVFSFTATSTQFVRMQITSNNGSVRTGFGEAAFGQAAAVPEPSTLALGSMLAAAGLGCAAVRRRRRAA